MALVRAYRAVLGWGLGLSVCPPSCRAVPHVRMFTTGSGNNARPSLLAVLCQCARDVMHSCLLDALLHSTRPLGDFRRLHRAPSSSAPPVFYCAITACQSTRAKSTFPFGLHDYPLPQFSKTFFFPSSSSKLKRHRENKRKYCDRSAHHSPWQIGDDVGSYPVSGALCCTTLSVRPASLLRTTGETRQGE